MEKNHHHPLLAFLWRPQEISKSIVEMAGRTSTRAIFDITGLDYGKTAEALISAGVKDVKIFAEQFMDPNLDEFLENTDIENIWIEYHPALNDTFSFDDFFDQISEFSRKYNCLPVASQTGLLLRLAHQDQPPRAICLKGFEASGLVSSETTGILFSTLRDLLKKSGRKTHLLIWGGISTPEAAAAFLCSGSTGIVFESLHWMTDKVSMDESLRRRIAKLRPEHTTIAGLNLNLPVRVFDKGNSTAAKELKMRSNSFKNGHVTDRERQLFAGFFFDKLVHPLESGFGKKELIPLGPEASFSESFAERFGRSTEKSIDNFLKEIHKLCTESEEIKTRLFKSKLAEKLQTRYPIIQGAMSWISDVPEFALKVAEAGGLPTFALGLRYGEELQRDLERMKNLLGSLPYAVNIITLSENPYRNEQLALIEKIRPPFVVIAAGKPAFAVKLLKKGIEVIYVASEEGLLRMALESGVSYVVLEGNEAGGHVGELSTLILSQAALDLKRKEPALFYGKHIILAGGIFNGETAFRASMLGAEGVQMGTAYLATEEIVSTGALSPLYQRMILESGPGMTAVTGESAGLRVRSLETPITESIISLEREFMAGNEDELSFRSHLEEMSAGSLLKAARGVAGPGVMPLDEETCLREGQFMSGAVAGAIQNVSKLSDLHREIAEASFEPDLPENLYVQKQRREKGAIGKTGQDRIAITGMTLVNALGNSPEDLWRAVLDMKSGIIEVPASKLNLPRYFDPKPLVRDKTYCKVAAFRDLDVSRKEVNISPQDFRTMSDSTKLTLWLAKHAIEESGIMDSDIPRERIGVIVSQNAGESASTLNDLVINLNAHKIVDTIGNIIRISPEQKSQSVRKIKEGRISYDDTTLLGRLNSGAAGFICNKYGFMGPSSSVAAACASSFVALLNALLMIRAGILDAAVIGGGEEQITLGHFLEFSALGALSGLSGVEHPPSECSRPFDADRDGMVLGEGGGILVIERESTAKKRGAHIHAYVTGMGASNNEKGMVESLAETQEIAMGNSFRDSAYGPDYIDLIECHATSTIQGDIEEVKALKSLFPSGKPTVLTSLKSQIGHTLGAAGINSLIRSVKAMQAGIYPPTLNYKTPDPEIGLEDWGFRVPDRPEDWPQPPNRPRRVMVNAFGFGGANYVVQLEQSGDSRGTSFVAESEMPASNTGAGKLKEGFSEIAGISFFNTRIDDRSYRVGVVASHENEARQKVAALDPASLSGQLSEKYLRILSRQGIFIAPAGERPPPLAFAFSGQGTFYSGMGKELYDSFDEIRLWIDRMAETAEFDLLELLFEAPDEKLQNTRWQQPALFTMEYAIARCLMSHGVKPVAVSGHSLGQNTALCLAEVFSPEDGFRLVNKRAECMEKAADLSGDSGAMLATDAPVEVLEKKIPERKNTYFTNFNSPNQVVVGGDTEEILALIEELKEEGFRALRLNVSMAFHSPRMEVIHNELEQFMDGIKFNPPSIPVISNTTMEPFPEDPGMIKKILMAHLESPVHWMQNVETLWNNFGIRLFVEIGPKDTLCNLIGEIVSQARCIQTCTPEDEAATFRDAAAQLFALGHLKAGTPPPHVDLPGFPSGTAAEPIEKASGNSIVSIVQREINSFVLESFGKFLKPQIIETVRREVDPSFGEEGLNRIINTGIFDRAYPQPVSEGRPSPSASGNRVVDEVEPPRSSVIEEKLIPPAEGDHLEAVIQIIMDATGYERDEIEPDMDIRQDLSIRSSRLPVIMDAAERQFGITINIEDFIGVRTVRELADRIASVAGRDAKIFPPLPPEKRKKLARAIESPTIELPDPEISHEREPLRRFVFNEVPLGDQSLNRLKLERGQAIAVLSPSRDSDLADEMVRFIKNELKASPLVFNFINQDEAGSGYDLRSSDEREELARKLTESGSLAGLVIILDAEANPIIGETKHIPSLMTGFFQSLKSLLRSQSKKFCLAVTRNPAKKGSENIAFEGVLGMFLSAAQEYSSVMFRSVSIDRDTILKDAMIKALNVEPGIIQTIFHGREAFTLGARLQPLMIDGEPGLKLGPDDVVILSGGGKGITNHIARALGPFKPRLVLLGRSESDPSIEENLKDISALGPDVSYMSCDVTDPARVREVIDHVIARFGKIDGIIHGAGILKDSFIELMSAADFEHVLNVKLLGAWNLYQSTRTHGLRFVVALSSITAIQGNIGQANYCAANRALSALANLLGSGRDSLLCKAFMLPPIAGAGMADNPETRDLLKLRGMETAYVSVDELGQFFCSELFWGPKENTWVMPARTLHEIMTVSIDNEIPESETGTLSSSCFTFRSSNMPMIQAVNRLDLASGELEAGRTFSLSHDLWIEDHKPFKALKHPLVSGIMAIETFLEAAYLLYPHLNILGVRQVEYRDILECPPNVDRAARIFCRRLDGTKGESICQVSISSQDISPTGRPLENWSTNYQGQVILGGWDKTIIDFLDFDILPEHLDTPPVRHKEILNWYKEGTALKGRYRVIESIAGVGPGVITGSTTYHQGEDFAGSGNSQYLYSPYLFEALMHLVSLYTVIRDKGQVRVAIPAGIGEIRFTRTCPSGELLTLEGRLKAEDDMGHYWDARAVDKDGSTIMTVTSLAMKWFT